MACTVRGRSKGFALEIPAGFGKSGVRSQRSNGGGVFPWQDRGIVEAVLYQESPAQLGGYGHSHGLVLALVGLVENRVLESFERFHHTLDAILVARNGCL